MVDKIAEFVRKKRVIHDDEVKNVEIKEVKIPWYKRPLEASEFVTRKGKDKKYYVQHNEWSKRVWIGPYNNENEAKSIIESYVFESLRTASLDKKTNNKIHSIIIENEKEFF
jgi:hypothetical protein